MAKPHIKLNNDGSMTYRVDAWQNGTSGQMIPGIDKTIGQAPSLFSPSILNNSQQMLSAVYMSDWLARKICDRPAEDAVRKFIEITGLDGEDKKIVEMALADLGIQSAIKKGIIWSRLFGGAGVLKIYDDARPPEVEPSESAEIIDLVPLDRWGLNVADIDDDPVSPYYGRALNYTARNGVVYHRSRVCAFYGAEVPYDAQIELNGWGGSYVAAAYNAIADYQTTLQDASFLLKESGIGILSVPGLTQTKAMGGSPLAATQARANAFNQGKSIYRTAIVDALEKFEFVSRSLAGIPDFIDRFATAVSGATDLGELILFNRSPSGLNATQEEQYQVYNDKVKAIQEGDPTPLVNEVIASIKRKTGLEFDWEWAPLGEMSPTQKGTIMGQVATAISTIEQAASLTPNEVRKTMNDSGLFKLDEIPEEPEDTDPLGLNDLGGDNGGVDIPAAINPAQTGQ